MLEDREKWLLKVIGFFALISTVLTVTLLASGHSLDLLNIINLYSLPLGIIAGWAIVTLIDSFKDKKK